MKDKTKDPQEKIETAIDSEELKGEELDQAVGGGSIAFSDIVWEFTDDPRKSGVTGPAGVRKSR